MLFIRITTKNILNIKKFNEALKISDQVLNMRHKHKATKNLKDKRKYVIILVLSMITQNKKANGPNCSPSQQWP